MTDEKRKLVEPDILRRAVVDSLLKLNPRTLMKNPVMFVVGVGSVLTTILFFKDGELVDKVIGAVPRPQLEQRIQKHLAA